MRHEREVIFTKARTNALDLARLGELLRERREGLQAVPEALREDALVSVVIWIFCVIEKELIEMTIRTLTRSSALVLAAAAALALAACGKKDTVPAPIPSSNSPSSMSTPSTTMPSDTMATPATGTAGTGSPDTATMVSSGIGMGITTAPGGPTGSSGTLSNSDGSTSSGTPGLPATPSTSNTTTTTR